MALILVARDWRLQVAHFDSWPNSEWYRMSALPRDGSKNLSEMAARPGHRGRQEAGRPQSRWLRCRSTGVVEQSRRPHGVFAIAPWVGLVAGTPADAVEDACIHATFNAANLAQTLTRTADDIRTSGVTSAAMLDDGWPSSSTRSLSIRTCLLAAAHSAEGRLASCWRIHP